MAYRMQLEMQNAKEMARKRHTLNNYNNFMQNHFFSSAKPEKKGANCGPTLVKPSSTFSQNGCDQKLSSDELEYRNLIHKRAERISTLRNIKLCQTSCEALDTEHNLKHPKISWFWTKMGDTISCSSDEENDKLDVPLAEMLETLTNYLRSTYLMCHWCSYQYQSENEMKKNCPGPRKFDHFQYI